jgi:hypothetical protein
MHRQIPTERIPLIQYELRREIPQENNSMIESAQQKYNKILTESAKDRHIGVFDL